jgi:hypothetical protein
MQMSSPIGRFAVQRFISSQERQCVSVNDVGTGRRTVSPNRVSSLKVSHPRVTESFSFRHSRSRPRDTLAATGEYQ